MTAHRKLIILALDGASPELVERWASQGHLPHLRKLMEEGAFGPLESVIPPVTGAAWGSFLTGLNPGRHGVFEWLRQREGGYHLGPIDGSALPGPTLFEWLSAHGLRVGAVSVPLSYPVREGIQGFVVTDLLTPPGVPYTYPRDLQPALERVLGRPYPLAPPPWPGAPRAEAWLRTLKDSLRLRAKAIVHLARRGDWDFFIAHVMETDSVQHQMWHTLDGLKRPRYHASIEGNPILEVYQRADALVGELLDAVGGPTGDVSFWVISDHGFGSHLFNLHLNTWLLREGFLQLKSNASTWIKRLLFELGIAPENLYPWEARLGLLGRAHSSDQAYRWLSRFALSMQNVDWSRTLAYSYGNVGQVFLNLRGREPQGIVTAGEAERVLTELEEALRAWRNPYTGERVVAQIHRKAALYGDRARKRAPDLVFLPAEGHSPMGLSEFLSNRVLSHPVAHSGWHRLDGVFVGTGGPLRRGRLSGLKLLDLFPTICKLFDVPIPEGLDGRVRGELLAAVSASTPAYASGREPGFASPAAGAGVDVDGAEDFELTPEEEALIRERLRGLGYL